MRLRTSLCLSGEMVPREGAEQWGWGQGVRACVRACVCVWCVCARLSGAMVPREGAEQGERDTTALTFITEMLPPRCWSELNVDIGPHGFGWYVYTRCPRTGGDDSAGVASANTSASNKSTIVACDFSLV